MFTLASTIFNQSALNLAKIYVTIRSLMSLIMGLIGLEQMESFALESEKLLYLTFVYTVASTIINQSAPNLVKIHDHKLWDEFDYGCNQTRTTGFIYP